MGFHYRKLVSSISDCPPYCHQEQSCSTVTDCDFCIQKCISYYNLQPPPPSHDHNKNKTSTYLIISFSIVAALFLVLCCYAIYVKFFSHRNRSRRRTTLLTRQQTEHGFVVDEEHDDGSVVDHPIWYIRTLGLHESIINEITVVKYKKDEFLIDGSDCSVCLSEFEENENLRLLPKCNHAFHLPCIDTWLRSHTNCPMCRAPIVVDPLRIPSMDHPNVFVESSHMEISVGNGNGVEDSVVNQLRNGEEEEEEEEVEEDESSGLEMVNMQQPRRSVSLDSSSAAKINLALSNFLSVESQGNSNPNREHVVEVNEQVASKRIGGNCNMVNMQSAPCSMKRSRSFNGKHLLSLYSSSQKKINPPVRSF